ncbi:hypothetical protein AB0H34_03090 [Saccharopolyspora shandongensis]|uniref:hypothetical protein n=1 Tax=Saccharopolyspora shandongensis TaxID=418495 RepID=UPI0033D19AE9
MIHTQDGNLDLVAGYYEAGWARFTPPHALLLFLVVGTAAHRNLDGSLEDFLTGTRTIPMKTPGETRDHRTTDRPACQGQKPC